MLPPKSTRRVIDCGAVSLLYPKMEGRICARYRACAGLRDRISRCMAGTLHIFKRHENPLEYQTSYNVGAVSWAKVFDPAGLDEFLRLATRLSPPSVEALLTDLRDQSHASKAPVEIRESQLVAMGFTELPSDE